MSDITYEIASVAMSIWEQVRGKGPAHETELKSDFWEFIDEEWNNYTERDACIEVAKKIDSMWSSFNEKYTLDDLDNVAFDSTFIPAALCYVDRDGNITAEGIRNLTTTLGLSFKKGLIHDHDHRITNP